MRDADGSNNSIIPAGWGARAVWALLAVGLGACATAPPPKPEPARETFQSAISEQVQSAVETFDPKAFAATRMSGVDCLAGATAWSQKSPSVGWATLWACVDRGTFPRGNFTSLRGIVNGPWKADLARRSEAGVLLAHVIALRGGDISGDLEILHALRLPLFALRSVMEQPTVFKGRMVLFRGRNEEIIVNRGVSTMHAVETIPASEAKNNPNGYNSYYNNYPYTYGKGGSTYRGTGESDASTKLSGVRIDCLLPKADPFLEKNKDYVFLGRVESVREDPSELEDGPPVAVPVITIINYFEPSPFVVD